MGFLDNLFGSGTEEKVSKAVDEAVVQGKKLGEKAVKKGKEAAKVAKEKATEAKYKVQIEKLKYSIGNEVVKIGLPIAKNDAKVKPLIDKIHELEKSLKKGANKPVNKAKKSSKK